MAEYYTRDESNIGSSSTEAGIHEHFDKLIYCLNQRREEVVTEFRQRIEERQAGETSRLNTLQQLTNSKIELENQIKENMLHSLREDILEKIDAKLTLLRVVERRTEVVFDCNTHQLEERISVLGELIERETIPTPDYLALSQPSISVGMKGTGEGELDWPRGVTFSEKFKLIYVADIGALGSCNGSINVFSITGKYIDRFCKGQVNEPCGIAISGDNNIFVSDIDFHCIFKFKLPKFKLVAKAGKKGTGVEQFNKPISLTVTTDGLVFVGDFLNDRVAVMTNDIKHKRYITHHTMTHPIDVKVNSKKVYVLSTEDSPCLHVFSLMGENIRSLITRNQWGDAQVRRSFSFCLDRKQNFIMGDYHDQSIKVFSQDGILLNTLGNTENEEKTIKPCKVTLTENNKIICTSPDTMFGLCIF